MPGIANEHEAVASSLCPSELAANVMVQTAFFLYRGIQHQAWRRSRNNNSTAKEAQKGASRSRISPGVLGIR